MEIRGGEKETLGQFALVAYIPDPLGRFLDDLRLELTPLSKPRAHVTILPPRPHDDDLAETIRRLVTNSSPFHSFDVEVGDVEIFAASHVIYLGLAKGAGDLRCLYRALNSGSLEFRENFPYHPHVTVAQNIDPSEAPALARIAQERWAGYRGPRSFTVSRLSFVQQVETARWIDVAQIDLRAGVLQPGPGLGL